MTALERLIAGKGRPFVIYSDNTKIFVASLEVDWKNEQQLGNARVLH